jgi:hypothetical protein
MAQKKEQYASPLALWNWGGPKVREQMMEEAARKRFPPTAAAALYPNLPSAQQPSPKKVNQRGGKR